MTFGSDPRRAVVTLADASVCALHARLQQTSDNGFVLNDEGSLAGTWVNYACLNGQGRRLRHGDLIHFGRLTYRFELADAPPPPEPVISLVEEEA
jgi:predicted component of type VI protein secretion system